MNCGRTPNLCCLICAYIFDVKANVFQILNKAFAQNEFLSQISVPLYQANSELPIPDPSSPHTNVSLSLRGEKSFSKSQEMGIVSGCDEEFVYYGGT